MAGVRNYPPHLQDVIHPHPLASLSQLLLACLGPDLIKAGDDEGSSLHLDDHLQLAAHNLAGDLWLGHVEHLGSSSLFNIPRFIIVNYNHLFAIHSPNIIHLLQASPVSGREPLRNQVSKMPISYITP